MQFKTYREGGLHCYLRVTPPPAAALLPDDNPDPGSRNTPTQQRLGRYLQWATRLTAGKSTWAIIRETPAAAAAFHHLKPVPIRWKYDVVANDTEGLGIDKGFVPAKAPHSPRHKEQEQGSLLVRTAALASLLRLPEDLLGDFGSQVTVVALQGEGQQVLETLRGDRTPQLSSMLGTDDLFLNLVVSKEQGYYDSFLVKAGRDIEEALSLLTS